MAKSSTTNNLIRGGQQFTLELNMFIQNFKNHFKIIMFAILILFGVLAYFIHDNVDRKWAFVWYKSYLNTQVFKGSANNTFVVRNGDENVTLSYASAFTNPSIIEKKTDFQNQILLAAIIAAICGMLGIYWHVRFIIKMGAKATDEELKRGARLASERETKKALESVINDYSRDRGRSRFNFLNFPLIQGSECSGIALFGSPGVGKSTELFSMCHQLRQQGNRCIVYDIGGEFASRYYREGIDHILNPFDSRSKGWDVWCEGRDKMTYDTIAKALIPESKSGDPIWYTAPRAVLAHTIAELGMRSSKPTVENLLRVIYRMDIKAMAKVLRDTDANAMFNTEADKFASSIRGILGTYCEPFRHLKSNDDPFSIKEWVRNDNDDSWVFITVTDEFSDTLAPLITVWFELFAKTFLSLVPSYDRRVGLLLDELPTLQQIPSLQNAMNVGRKYGLVPIIGFQSYYLLAEIYGQNKAKAMLDAINIHCAFRCNGDDGAEAAAKQLGKQEIEQGKEGYTVGQADLRDATNVNRDIRDNRNIVLASEIQALADEECYVNFHRGIPICKTRTRFKKPEAIEPTFSPIENVVLLDPTTHNPLNDVVDIDAYLSALEDEVKREQQEAEAAKAQLNRANDETESEPLQNDSNDIDQSTFMI